MHLVSQKCVYADYTLDPSGFIILFCHLGCVPAYQDACLTDSKLISLTLSSQCYYFKTNTIQLLKAGQVAYIVHFTDRVQNSYSNTFS